MIVNVQFGCGLSAPNGWKNFDASPTLRIQKIPIIGRVLTRHRVTFPAGVCYGDVLKGLPLKDGEVDNLYCSHVLEHLSHDDFHLALAESYRILKPGGEFRIVMPDLRAYVKNYLESTSDTASVAFIRQSMLGVEKRPRGLFSKLIDSYGNHQHLWLWDEKGTINSLKEAGFKSAESYEFNKTESSAFAEVQDESRFYSAVSVRCSK